MAPLVQKREHDPMTRRLDPQAALVLFSGGQDSAIALAWALDRFARVETVGFDYGQRHVVELAARDRLRAIFGGMKPAWAARLGADTRIDLQGLAAIGETAMTREAEIALGEDGLPTTFVPGRNLAFFVMAGALAYRRGLGVLVGGMCEADYSGYPDCREGAIRAQEAALRLGMDADGRIETPLMQVSKAQSWALAERIGGTALVEAIRVESHTCYRGVREALHDWGYGCGDCPACDLRAKGWRAYAGDVA